MATAAAKPVALPGPWSKDRTIKDMYKPEWDVTEPRPVQMEAVKELMKTRSLMLIQGTGGGKSLVFLGAAAIVRQASSVSYLCMVLLVRKLQR